ncbi:hypothetical protein A3C59_00625 [Candidatus Daviesbacteria bacterium RIFCSPHIGHO2_02_FULL_36_13]|uniref:Glycosyltransferase RgtA/B/C/D-like domain-containing protein n=1 Tax=Candidatus Daviesbacteria bacterium RIFCSPHIGHO2_02_FULL_36_13 TaxID=1797768 RepID=A0A1F5JPB1_9BACT|nr:MAG: hypothetical protein A3C59_00625 [Candidatus Daviesbacteria bacterium RIFCSPHIGHO2_02_FULL_36_13]
MVKLFLIAITALSLLVNLYRISEVPPSLSWDEASVGYDAYAISIDGKDQWGEKFPLAFKSFEEYKYPFHIYSTSLFVSIFGLSEFSVRAPSAILGVFNVLILFFLIKVITKKEGLALISALFLSISPWFIHFSRLNWEINFALFFFLLGLLFFFYGLSKKSFFLILSFIFFGIDLYTYNASKIFVPVFLLILTFIYRKELLSLKYITIVSFIAFGVIISFSFFNPSLSGLTRFQQVSFDQTLVRNTILYKISKNHYLGRAEIILKQYLSHFSPQFLFKSGDSNPRHSSQVSGQLYITDLFLIPLGLLFLVKSKEKYRFIFLAWFLLAPLPAAIAKEAPHASRTMFALGGWQVVSALGVLYLIKIIGNDFKKIVTRLLVVLVLISFFSYLYGYFYIYSNKYAHVWQYGYKVFFDKYKSRFSEFDNILISDRYDQPYIFALFYLKYNPEKFRSEVSYNDTIRRKTSLVKSFDKFTFRDIDYYQISKGRNLIFTHPTDKMDEIEWKEIIRNPDGSIGGYVYEYEK